MEVERCISGSPSHQTRLHFEVIGRAPRLPRVVVARGGGYTDCGGEGSGVPDKEEVLS